MNTVHIWENIPHVEAAHNTCAQNDKCNIDCRNQDLNRVLNASKKEQKAFYQSMSFWLIFFFWVFGATANSGVNTFQDAIATQCVEDHFSGETFGHQRLWASVGWGSSALIVGYVVDNASSERLLFDYSPAFIVMTILWTIDIFVIGKIPVSYKSFLNSMGNVRSRLIIIFLSDS